MEGHISAHESFDQESDNEVQIPYSVSVISKEKKIGLFQIPEPLDLMPKSIISIDETIKTGAAIGFLALERFNAGKLIREKLAAENGNANLLNPDNPYEATPA